MQTPFQKDVCAKLNTVDAVNLWQPLLMKDDDDNSENSVSCPAVNLTMTKMLTNARWKHGNLRFELKGLEICRRDVPFKLRFGEMIRFSLS